MILVFDSCCKCYIFYVIGFMSRIHCYGCCKCYIFYVLGFMSRIHCYGGEVGGAVG